MSLFRRKKSASSNNVKDAGLTASSSFATLPLPRSNKASRAPKFATTNESGSSARVASHIDDFGRPLGTAPAFVESDSPQFGRGYGVGEETELQLLYGYAPIETTRELSVQRVVEIVQRCAQEIRLRGLSTPLILSSMSLDINMEGTCSLIRSYLTDPKAWAKDLHLANPLQISAQLKWGLGRLINDAGERGFLKWDTYNSFKLHERADSYPANYCTTHLITRLPTHNSTLLSTLLSLFSSVAAYSAVNGMTPRKIASLFSPYIFGLADDQPFEETYREWQRSTDATEHIILSYIRDQKATSGQIPTHLEHFIGDYPQCLNISYSLDATPRLPPGARVEEVTRVRRLTRFHSRNLIQSAGAWEVPNSREWDLFFPSPPSLSDTTAAPKKEGESSALFTPYYRHLLNIRSNLQDNEDEGDMQRYKTGIEKEWGRFGEIGFQESDPSKLDFDLTEGERRKIAAKRDTMDWGTFASSGFGGRETFAPTDLIFHQNIAQRVQQWPTSQKAMSQRLHATEKLLPAFPYDTTPSEEPKILVDALWFEAWADVLVSGGWARDELKETSFALIQWKARPRDGEVPRGRITSEGEGRTEDRWVLAEEFVPKEYRDELRDGKKKSSRGSTFLRAVRIKGSNKPLPRLNVTQITHPSISAPLSIASPYTIPRSISNPRQIDNSVFSAGNGDTKVLSLSSVNLASASTYAPSIISTTGAGHGHTSSFQEEEPSSPATPVVMGQGVDGTQSSQRRESSFEDGRGPLGYTKPLPARGFLARITSRKGKRSETTTAALPTHTEGVASSSPPAPSKNGRSPPAPGPVVNVAAPKSDLQRKRSIANKEDAYGGMDEGTDEEGTVLFRGSRSYPQDMDVHAAVDTPDIKVQSPPRARPLPRIPAAGASSPETARSEQSRESFPSSPPQESEEPHSDEASQLREKYQSGSSNFSKIVGLYEDRDAQVANGKNVRLTQYGFGASAEDDSSRP